MEPQLRNLEALAIASSTHPTETDIKVPHQSHRNSAGKPSKSHPLHLRSIQKRLSL